MSNKSITPNEDANFTPSLGEYMELQPFRYWCQKVLPLVYDDSLSYFELLCKVIDYLNKTIEDVETLHGDVTNLHNAYTKLQTYVNSYFSTLDVQQEINNKLDEMAKNGALTQIFNSKFFNVVTPILYGAVGDGISDDLTAFNKAIKFLNENNGGILYIPPKTFAISDTIFVPSNVSIVGCGVNSVIKMIDSSYSRFGTCIGVCGDNVIINNLFITFSGWEIPSITGSVFGCIGISNGKFFDGMTYPNDYENRNNVVIKNIYTDKFYSVNSECHGLYTMNDITYDRLHGDSLVSIQYSNGEISNVNIKNSEIGYLRIGSGGSGKLNNCLVSDCVIRGGRSTKDFVMENCAIINSDNSNKWNLEGILNSSFIFQDTFIKCNNIRVSTIANNISNGLYLRNSSICGFNLEVETNGLSIRDDNSLNTSFLYNFKSNQKFNLTGEGININAEKNNSTQKFYDNRTEIYYYTKVASYDDTAYMPSRCYLTNKNVELTFGASNITLSDGLVVAKVNEKLIPSKDIYFIGFVRSTATSTGVANIIRLTLNTNGEIVTEKTFNVTDNLLLFNVTYNI